MKRAFFNRYGPDTNHGFSLLQLLRISVVGAGAFLVSTVTAGASTTTEKLSLRNGSIVESIKGELPIKTRTNGTVVAIETPVTPLIVTTNMGNIEAEKMSAPEMPEIFKNAIMVDFRAFLGEPFVPLAEAAFNAGLPFTIHFTSETYPQGFSVTFSLKDLEQALRKESSDN